MNALLHSRPHATLPTIGILAILLLPACESDFHVTKTMGEIAVTPILSDLGVVAVGGSVDFQLQITNDSRIDVIIYGVDIEAGAGEGFSCEAGTEDFTVPSESNAWIPCFFQASEAGYHWANLVVRSDSREPDLSVMARAQAVEASLLVSPLLLDFGPAEPGSTARATLTLNATSGASLSLDSASFGSKLFSLAGSLPVELPAGEDISIELLFQPIDLAPVEATLTLGADPLSVDVLLRGNDCERGLPELYDTDSDGYAQCGDDCDDTNDQVHPGAVELADGLDQDCDGIIDEGTEAYDDDGDGYSELEGDCNDGDPTVSPGTPEDFSNGQDDDCDGIVDSGIADLDLDGYATEGGDCNDAVAAIHPGAEELLDGLDNDCDGIIDEETDAYDDDHDGYSELAGDCDDTLYRTNPGAIEIEDWRDNDCDGEIDEGTRRYDDDDDGFTENGGDCNDSNAAINPAESETTGNSVDENCNGSLVY